MEIGAEQPIYGKYDSAFDEELKPYIDNLVAARGQIDCPQAFKLAKKLQEECAEFLESEPSRYRNRLVKGLCALRCQWLPMGKADRGLCPLESTVRPMVQDAILWG